MSNAELSYDDANRFTLSRNWRSGDDNSVLWILKNPSTAGVIANDHTVSLLINLSKQLGFFGMVVCNLSSRRGKGQPIGTYTQEDLNYVIRAIRTQRFSRIVYAWGVTGNIRVPRWLSEEVDQPWCIGKKQCGEYFVPKSPLRKKLSTLVLERF